MNPHEASVKLSYDKLTSGHVSIKLRVSYGKKRVRFHLPIKAGVIVSSDMYERISAYHQSQNKRTAEEVRTLYNQVRPSLDKAEEIINTLSPFDFNQFDKLFYGEGQLAAQLQAVDVVTMLRLMSADMDAQGRIGNADNYTSAAQSLSRFVAQLSPAELSDLNISKDLLVNFGAVTVNFLHRYENWMLQSGTAPRKPGGACKPASLTTVSMYLRAVRAVFNLAIEKKLITSDQYPFGKKAYVIPTGRNVKKALRKEQIKQIMAYDCASGSEQRSRDLWILSYLSNGANLTDLCNLRWSNVSLNDNTIIFSRQKTALTKRSNAVTIVATLFEESKAIIERWASPGPRLPSNRVFSFVSDEMDARRRKRTITQLVKQTNKYMRRIADEIGIPGDVRTYAARHSFGSALLKSGANLVFIKEKYGHSSIKTTELYTTSLMDEDEHDMLRDSLL